ncbi:transcription elongation factor GreA [Candidatus Endobugula sertula]|uniref:Transcription elongation factor GreA n=1 Tax=Candidatus Endobugula sertula TaxID=62101 RepID=A0A1D2QND2_9GAMM|nr:transcription elongation factor GreA [Candidatus Endobugula sertula]
MNKVPMTKAGADALETELEDLKKVQRPRIVQAIAEAREHGDLKENAEYHAAREQQGFCEGRIQDIEGKLSNAQIIDITELPNTGRVIFGVTVDIINIDTDKKVTYQIVGDDESDVNAGKISVNSPIARGLIGKSEGDDVVIKTPAGQVEYEIESVRHI